MCIVYSFMKVFMASSSPAPGIQTDGIGTEEGKPGCLGRDVGLAGERGELREVEGQGPEKILGGDGGRELGGDGGGGSRGLEKMWGRGAGVQRRCWEEMEAEGKEGRRRGKNRFGSSGSEPREAGHEDPPAFSLQVGCLRE